MPAFVKSRFGESGMRLEDGTMLCSFDLKKSKNDWRIWVEVMVPKISVFSIGANVSGMCARFFVRMLPESQFIDPCKD